MNKREFKAVAGMVILTLVLMLLVVLVIWGGGNGRMSFLGVVGWAFARMGWLVFPIAAVTCVFVAISKYTVYRPDSERTALAEVVQCIVIHSKSGGTEYVVVFRLVDGKGKVEAVGNQPNIHRAWVTTTVGDLVRIRFRPIDRGRMLHNSVLGVEFDRNEFISLERDAS